MKRLFVGLVSLLSVAPLSACNDSSSAASSDAGADQGGETEGADGMGDAASGDTDHNTEETSGGSDTDHSGDLKDAGEGATKCALLASECHHADHGDGAMGQQCHEIGHEQDEAACIARFDECIAFCTGDGGAEAHEHDAGEHTSDVGDSGAMSSSGDASSGPHDASTALDAGEAPDASGLDAGETGDASALDGSTHADSGS